jgi:hypothetical protein
VDAARTQGSPVAPRQRCVGPIAVVVALECPTLHLQVCGRPEERAIQAFASKESAIRLAHDEFETDKRSNQF